MIRWWLVPVSLIVSGAVFAQAWPQRPVRLIVPFPPGGSADMLARFVAPKMGDALGQAVVVENRGGAGGILGVEAAVKSTADGYTIVMPGPGALTILPHLTKMPFAPLTDLAYLTIVARVPNVVTVNGKLGIGSLDDLMKAASRAPGKLNYASAGSGSSLHLAGALLAQELKIDIVHVPYKGVAPAITDLVGGQVQILVGNANAVLAHVRSGSLKALAVTTPQRSAQLAEVPSVVELGLRNLVSEDNWGLAAPAKTPAAVLEKLRQAAVAAVRSREVADKIIEQAALAGPSTAEEYSQWVRVESEKWAQVIKRARITLE